MILQYGLYLLGADGRINAADSERLQTGELLLFFHEPLAELRELRARNPPILVWPLRVALARERQVAQKVLLNVFRPHLIRKNHVKVDPALLCAALDTHELVDAELDIEIGRAHV